MADYLTKGIFTDRRKKSLFNRVRRFINDYWFVPLLTLYLQFIVLFLPPGGPSLKSLYEKNIYLLKGPAVLYNLLTIDFPYTLFGHFEEVAIRAKYGLGIYQVTFDDIAASMGNNDSAGEVYSLLLRSKKYHNTELGGIVSISYEPDGPRIHLYEVPSMNRVFSERLHRAGESSIEDFCTFITDDKNIDFLGKIQGGEVLTNNMLKVLSSDTLDKTHKKRLISSFIDTYDMYSESRYILSPYDFKSFLGSTEIEGRYLGIFHLHNTLNDPPSDMDVASSYNDRQIVITFTEGGFMVYDIAKGKQNSIEVDFLHSSLSQTLHNS